MASLEKTPEPPSMQAPSWLKPGVCFEYEYDETEDLRTGGRVHWRGRQRVDVVATSETEAVLQLALTVWGEKMPPTLVHVPLGTGELRTREKWYRWLVDLWVPIDLREGETVSISGRPFSVRDTEFLRLPGAAGVRGCCVLEGACSIEETGRRYEVVTTLRYDAKTGVLLRYRHRGKLRDAGNNHLPPMRCTCSYQLVGTNVDWRSTGVSRTL